MEPIDGSSFGDMGIAVEAGSLVVRNKEPAGFAVETKVSGGMFFIFGPDTGEREVHGKALVRDGGGFG